MKTDDTFGLSRRRLLAGLATVGTASSATGFATTALLSDREEFTDNTLVGGRLDLAVAVRSVYDGAGETPVVVEGVADGSTAVALELTDVKPGDSGRLRFDLDLTGNPAYLWLCTRLTANDENGQPEPELNHAADDSTETGELADALQATLGYCDADGELLATIASGSLADVLDAIAGGLPLDGTGDETAVAGEQVCYAGSDYEAPDGVVNPALCLDWELPFETGNEVQTDTVGVDVAFSAFQCRHNDGTRSPCAGGGDTEEPPDEPPEEHDAPAISFVAFGTDEELSGDVAFSNVQYKEENEPIGFDWASDDPVDRIVVKGAQCWQTVDLSPPATAGTVVFDECDPVADGQSENAPLGNSGLFQYAKYNYNGDFVPDDSEDSDDSGDGGSGSNGGNSGNSGNGGNGGSGGSGGNGGNGGNDSNGGNSGNSGNGGNNGNSGSGGSSGGFGGIR
ncbi:hypothetical protein SAMN04487949_2526 [Halogranum gelatinilyticum]|uniref:SipW-cognate class signal peptide n=1 Tax=Halogranum gelatinilyticum TaxID=660521 RepID=A0A1G9VVD2_9EURY|nr:hypothetical protein [Halogranum gelatinilyticum]SDM76262.1 hypothetical protein SAMN04487949_2526 [Halogranum gelatinilyticum]